MKTTGKNLFQLLSSLFLVLMLTVFLFLFNADGYSSIARVRSGAFYVLCGLLFVGAAVFWLEGRLTGIRLGLPEDVPKQLALPELALLVYGGCTVLSGLFSDYRWYAFFGAGRFEGVWTILLYLGLFFFFSYFSCVKKWMAWLFAGVMTLFALLCILQLAGKNPFGLYPAGVNYYDAGKLYAGAYLGPIGNVDFTGAFLCLAIPVLLLSVPCLQGRSRLLLLVPALLCLYVAVRMNVLACIAGLLAAAAVAPVARFQKRRVPILIALAVLGVLCAAVLLLVDMPADTLPFELQQLLRGKLTPNSGSGRIYIWTKVWERVPERLFFGHGPDSLVFSGIPPFQRYDEALDMQLTSYVDAAHNEYLHILFCQGIFALLAYLTALVSLAVSWFRYAPRSRTVFLFGTAVLAYCVQAFFGISQDLLSPFFWIAAGLLNRQIKSAKLMCPDKVLQEESLQMKSQAPKRT